MIKTNIEHVREEIRQIAVACGRKPEYIRLIAVSKTVSTKHIKEALQWGVMDLGENYVQEAREKIETLGKDACTWHFIGHLQTNKAKYVVKLFDLIHSLDSLKLAKEINKRARAIDKVQQVLVQVNISGEKTKSGIAMEEAIDLVRQISRCNNLAVKGLMTMPPFFNEPEKVRPFFRRLRILKERIEQERLPGVVMNELSMGMTGDFKAAIEEGATMVRIGTAIFGPR